MRVLYLTMNPNRGGTTAATEGWLRTLVPRGLAPVVASDAWGPFPAWVRAQGWSAYALRLPHPDKLRPGPFLRALWRLARLARAHRVQLVHCNEQDIYPLGQYLARLCGLPVAVSIHLRLDRPFCRWAFGGRRRPSRMFFVSESCRRDCKEALRGVVPPEDCFVLRNGLDLSRYATDRRRGMAFRRAFGLTESDAVIGVGCLLRPCKQLEHFIESAARLQTPNVKFLLAGGPAAGDEAYAARLLRTARERLGPRFLHVGKLPRLDEFCSALDLFVNTSREESFCIAALEALACGAPVVGYPSRGVEEVILPDGGQIIAQDQIDELAAAVDAWLADRPRLAAARRAARRQAERFDIRPIALQLWGHYEELVKGALQTNHQTKAVHP